MWENGMTEMEEEERGRARKVIHWLSTDILENTKVYWGIDHLNTIRTSPHYGESMNVRQWVNDN